jgi:hypothetical protein
MHAETSVCRGQQLLEDTLAEVRQAVSDCFAAAREIPPEADEYGHHRAREFENATGLLKMGAELGCALARVRGEFNHNIRVTRDETMRNAK